jgi:RNA polymerase sigma-70 factor (ECF subfamily)
MEKLTVSEQFLVLLTSNERRLRGYVRALVPNRADAEEILQEVNLYLCRHADEFEPGTDFVSWALKVAHFRVLKWRERRSHERLVFDDSLIERLVVAAESMNTDRDRRYDALKKCLEKLAPSERELVMQFYGEAGATPRSLAERIGRSVKGVYVTVHRLRMKLLECIRCTLAAEEHV